MVQRTAFFPLPQSTLKETRIFVSIAHLAIIKKQVYNIFIAQSIQKISGSDKINFRILFMIWN